MGSLLDDALASIFMAASEITNTFVRKLEFICR